MARRKQNVFPWLLGLAGLYFLWRPQEARAANGNGNGNGNGGIVDLTSTGQPVLSHISPLTTPPGGPAPVYLGEDCFPPQPIPPGGRAFSYRCKFRALLPEEFRAAAGAPSGNPPPNHSGWSIPRTWQPDLADDTPPDNSEPENGGGPWVQDVDFQIEPA